VKRLAIVVLAAGAMSAGMSATAAAPPAVSYRVAGVSASARLVYGGGTSANLERDDGTVVVTARKASGKQPRSNGSLTAHGGRIRVALTVRTTERASIKERSSKATPYVEHSCANSSLRKVAGGVVLTRVAGNRVRVTWAFPQANAVTCPGPSGVGAALLARMTRTYAAGTLASAHPRLSLSGTAPFKRGKYTGTYTWRASLGLVRLTAS
jgi:hypothetical protein